MPRTEGYIAAVVGVPGSGKSLFLAQCLVEGYDDGYRKCVTNLPFYDEEVKKICPEMEMVHLTNKEIATYWRTQPKGVLVILDECHLVYDAQEWRSLKAEVDDITEYWSTVRHSGDRVYVASQAFADIILFIRRRVESCECCWRFPFKIFLRRKWFVRSGEIGEASSFYRLIPFSFLRQYARLYNTHGAVGIGTGREAAKRAAPNKVRFVYLLIAIVLVIVGFVGVRLVAGKTSQAVVPSVVPATVPASRSFNAAPVVVRPPVVINRGKYEASEPGSVVLAVKPDTVTLGDSRGRVREVPRNCSDEYSVIERQRRTRWAGEASRSESTVSSGGARDYREPGPIGLLGGQAATR